LVEILTLTFQRLQWLAEPKHVTFAESQTLNIAEEAKPIGDVPINWIADQPSGLLLLQAMIVTPIAGRNQTWS